jgi:hypothetical protein
MKHQFTIGHHETFRREMLAGLCHERDFDEIDELAAADPFNGDPPARRSDKEIGRLLSLLDSLDTKEERGNH